jgi:hypothetical protein
MNRLNTTAICLLALMTQAAHAADPVLPVFNAANFANPKTNTYFPLEIGTSHTLRGTRTDQAVEEYAVLTVQGPGPVILGVPTVLVLDEAFEDGVLVERTFDYFAADKDGNVWYFGEDVTNFRYEDAGALTGTDSKSAWRAGVNDALPGISFSGAPVLGLTLFQEHAPMEEAMDYAEVVAVGLEITGPAGTFKDVVKTFEGSTVEADLREFKYYAPGVGMIRAEEDLSEALDAPGIVVELQP